MDFIEGLPKAFGSDVIYVVIDRFTKYVHFLPLTSHYTTKSVAQVLFEHVFKLHGLPGSIVSDRDRVFTSLFWQDFFFWENGDQIAHVHSLSPLNRWANREGKQVCGNLLKLYVFP